MDTIKEQLELIEDARGKIRNSIEYAQSLSINIEDEHYDYMDERDKLTVLIGCEIIEWLAKGMLMILDRDEKIIKLLNEKELYNSGNLFGLFFNDDLKDFNVKEE